MYILKRVCANLGGIFPRLGGSGIPELRIRVVIPMSSFLMQQLTQTISLFPLHIQYVLFNQHYVFV